MTERRLKPYPAYNDSGVEWLGEVPTHWEARKLKRICALTYGESMAADSRADGEVEVYGSNGPVGYHDRANTQAPCLVVGRKGSFGKVNYSTDPVFAIDTTFFVDARSTRTDLRWLFYALADARLDVGSKDSAIPGLDREDAYAHDLCLPPPEEQRSIAAFLDRETARIDALAAKKERLIELLQEQRTALITSAVTKGLNQDARMKHSGVEWLGQIPAHWQVKQLGQAVQTLMDFRGRTPAKLGMDWGGDIPAVSAVNVREGFLDLSRGVNYGSQALHDRWMSQGPTRMGDVLFTTEAPLGNVALVPDDHPYILSQRVVLFRPPSEKLIPEYLQRFLISSAFRQGVELQATGSTAEGVKRRHLMAMAVCVPSVNEQRAIAAFLDRETARIDALIARVGDAIARLKELRTALISAAVTGKIDVREEVA